MILNKIKKFFIKNKKEILFFSFLAIFIFSIGDTFAATDTTNKSADGVSSLIEGINFLVKIFASLLGLLTSLVSLLLNPGWVNGTIFGFDVYLKDIWILISNIVYFIFAFILIIIAFMNIVGQGGGTWELKSALPKFVVGVVMVPFTWFFVQFVLSISAFLTVAVLSLPYDVMADKPVYIKAEKKRICTVYTFDLTTNDKKESTDSTKELEDCLKDPSKSITIGELLSGKLKSNTTSSSIFSIINIYTYGIMKIQDTDKITKNQLLKGVKKLPDLGVKAIFDILFMIVFLLIMIALFMALFSRGVRLWLYAMFSPVFGLLFFFGKSKEGIGTQKIGPFEFIKLAMVPVYVAAALAFGMVFIFVAAQGLTEKQTDGKSLFTTEKDGGVNYSVLTLGDFKIRLKGIQGGATNTNTLFNSLGNGIGQLLLEIFGLVILWIAVMAALKSSEITHNVVKPIISFGESVGSLVSKAPQYVPIIPTPGGGRISAQGLQKIGQMPMNSLNSRVSKHVGGMQSKMDSLFGVQTANLQKLNELHKKLINEGITAKNFNELQKSHFDLIKNHGINDSNVNDNIKEYLTKLKETGPAYIKTMLEGVKIEDYGKNGKVDQKILKALSQTSYISEKVNTERITTLKNAINKGGNPTNKEQENNPEKSKTASDSTTAHKQAEKNLKIGSINYKVTKNSDTLKFDNTKNGGADFDIKKAEILENGKINDEKIKKVLKDANIEDGVEEIIKEVKKEFGKNN